MQMCRNRYRFLYLLTFVLIMFHLFVIREAHAEWSSVSPLFDSSILSMCKGAGNDIYINGNFSSIADFVRWDGSAWNSVGVYPGGWSDDMEFLNGKLYVAKDYDVDIWDGTSWTSTSMIPYITGTILAMAVDGSGNIYVGGYFTDGSGNTCVLMWNGASWSTIGTFGSSQWIYTLEYDLTNNKLYVGGQFNVVNSTTVNNITVWNGTSWSDLSGPSGNGTNAQITALAIDSAGSIYAGGSFTSAGGVSANYIAKWNGAAWSALGNGLNSSVSALAFGQNGDLYASGSFTATSGGGTSVNHIAKWDGTAWSALDSGLDAGAVHLAFDGTFMYAGGSFTTAGGISSPNIARWREPMPPPGNALDFDGVDDRVEITDAPELNFDINDNFTVSLWVKIPPLQNDTGTVYNTIIDKWDAGVYPFVIRILNQTAASDTGEIHCARWDGTNGPTVQSLTPLNDDLWHHIAFVKNGSTLYLYVDGRLNDTQPDTVTGSTVNAASLSIGCQTVGPEYFFTGNVDEVRIWNMPRTREHIQSAMNNEINPLTNGLVAYYRFDQITGNILPDLTGGNDGTVLNGPLWADSDAFTVWTGADTVDPTNWNDIDNWSGGVPTALDNVSIPAVGTYPDISASASCNHLVVETGASLNMSAGTLNINGNLINYGIFNATGGTTALTGWNQAIYGSNTFFNLSKIATGADSLVFEAGSIQNISGALTLQGANTTDTLSLQSSAPGVQWQVNPVGSRTIGYIDVMDSNNTNVTSINAIGTGSVDQGNNTNWIFVGVSSVSSTAADQTYGVNAVIPVAVAFTGTVNVSGTPQLTLETGASDAVVNYASGSGTTELTFNYTVASGHASTDLDYVSSTALALNGASIADQSGNPVSLALPSPGLSGSLGFNNQIVIETVPPTVTLSSSAPEPTNLSPFTVTALFSENVTGFALADISVINGAVSNLTGSAASYTFDVTPGADGLVTLTIPANAVQDTAGNNNTVSASLSRTYDGSPPSVTLTSAAPDPTNTSPFSVTAVFSEPVTGFALIDIGVSNASVSNLAGSGTTYSFDVTPSSNGLTTVDIPAGAAQDAAGNNNTASVPLSRTYDTVSPTVTLSSAAPDPTNTSPFSVTAVFSEPVTGFALIDIGVSNAVISNLTGSGTTYAFDVTPASNGLATVDIPAGAAQDSAGNTNTASGPLSRTYDSVSPTVTLSSAAPDPTNTSPFSVTAVFSKEVTGFTAGEVSLHNCSLNSFSGSGTTYTFDVIPSADGLATVTIPAGAAQDGAGNDNTASAPLSRTYDTAAPSVTLMAAVSNPTNSSPFSVTVAFSETVAGFEIADIVVSNASVGNLAGSGADYTFDVTPAANGLVTVNIPAGAVQDTAGNSSSAAAELSRTYDSAALLVTLSSPVPEPTNISPFSVTVSFSKPVTGFIQEDVTVTNGTISGFSGQGADYAFNVTPLANGPATVNIPANAAQDAAGNSSAAAAPLTRTYDTVAPVVTQVNSPVDNGTYGEGMEIELTVEFSEPVTLANGDLTIHLDTGGTAVITELNSMNSVSAIYTIAANHGSLDLDATSLSLTDGASLRDSAGNDALLDIPQGQSLADLKDIAVNTVIPLVSNVYTLLEDGVYGQGTEIPIVITFTMPVNVNTVNGTPQLAMAAGADNVFANYVSGSGTTELTFSFTTEAGQRSPGLDYTSASALNLNGGTITNLAGTMNADLTLPEPGSPGSLSANSRIRLNNPPSSAGIEDIYVNEDAQTYGIYLTEVFSDIEDGPNGLTYMVFGNTNQRVLSASIFNNILSLDFLKDAFGSTTVTVRATDSGGLSADAAFTVMISPVNDAPVASAADPAIIIDEDLGRKLVNLLEWFSDIDNSALSFSVQSNSNDKMISAAVSDNRLILETNPDENGFSEITVRATDNGGLYTEIPFKVTVRKVNDPPVITDQKRLETLEETPVTITLEDLTVEDPDNDYPDDFRLNLQQRGQTILEREAGVTSIALGDINGDGRTDLVLGTFGRPDRLFLGSEEEALFDPNSGIDVGDSTDTIGIALGDEDLDGDLDILAAFDDETAGIYHNSGGGSFTLTVSDETAVSLSRSGGIALGDVNGDGLEDMVVLSGAQILLIPNDTDFPNPFYALSGDDSAVPLLNYSGVITIPVTVNDGRDDSNVWPLQIMVTPVNDPPEILGQRKMSILNETEFEIELTRLSVADPDNTYPDDFSLKLYEGENYRIDDGRVIADTDFSGVLTIPLAVHDGFAYSGRYDFKVSVGGDGDRDGMEDGWEVLNGLDPTVNDAMNDPDRDGYVNIREYLCDTDPLDPESYPMEPEAVTGPSQVVKPGDTVYLGGDTEYPELDYVWTQISGTQAALSVTDSARTSFTAPDSPGVLEFELAVSNRCGDDAAGRVVVNVTPDEGEPPVADAGDAQTVKIGDTVILNGAGSYDPDGQIVHYEWKQTGGDPFQFETERTVTEFRADTVGEFTFILTVTDDQGLKAVGACDIEIELTGDESNQPPDTPVIVAPENERRFDPGESVVLSAGPYSDPENDPHFNTVWLIWPFMTENECIRKNDAYRHVVTGGVMTEYLAENLVSGMKYAWKAGYTDAGSGETSWSETGYFKTGPETVQPVVIAPGNRPDDFPIISFSVWPNDPSAEAVFGPAIGTYSRREYLIGTYDPMTGGYREYGNGLTIEPGRAYWVMAFDGLAVDIRGVPVTPDADVALGLRYDAEYQDGWNMIACPNDRSYVFGDLEIKKTGEDCRVELEPTPISALADGNPYIDKRLWDWKDGTYQTGSGVLESGKGYWIFVNTTGVSLIFPADAPIAEPADESFRSTRIQGKAAYPPAPPSGDIMTDDSAGSGCFMSTIELKK